MTAVPIPRTLRVQCKCGWQGTTEDLRDKTCPICGEAFKAWPAVDKINPVKPIWDNPDEADKWRRVIPPNKL